MSIRSAEPKTGAPAIQLLIGDSWRDAATKRFGNVYNPSTGQIIARVPFCTATEVDAVVQAASAALPEWSQTPPVERARVLFRFRELLLANFERLARLVTREHGKTLIESRASVQRGIEVIEYACGIPNLLMGQALPEIATNVDAEAVRHPVGVCVGITPFNFPSMVPMWMFPIAIACGNTFVLKPSEKVPLSANALGELMLEAGLPPGVFNIVHGDRECVEALLAHPLVRAVSFVGSTPAARGVYETATRNGKRVQAAGGAKNHMVIMPDANLEQAAAAIQASAFGCSGQRCMAGSLAVAVGDIGAPLVEMLKGRAERMRVGPTDQDEKVDMGPLVTREHRDRVAGYLDVARGEGARVVLDGRTSAPKSDGFFLGPSIVDEVAPNMRVAKEEIFGPVLCVSRVANLEQALDTGHTSPYGNGAVIFTQSGHAAREFKRHCAAGMVGINVGVPAPMAWFPFTGWNHSFFGDLHIQGTEAVQFYTQQKVTLTRWFASTQESTHDPIWRQK